MPVLMIILLSTHAWAFDHAHRLFGEVLSNNVTRTGQQTFVNYKSLKDNPEKLKNYIATLGAVKKDDYRKWTKDEKLAALINGYNAWTIKLIIDHYPVSSIKDIGPFYKSPWKEKFINWLGDKVSLDHIEHEVIRKDFQEPRIHFALVCAALGCPPLQEVPFEASKLNSQLENATVEFLKDSQENSYELKDDKLTLEVSSIFKWYGKDFGTESELTRFIVSNMKIEDRAKDKKVVLDYKDYDWKLNEKK